MASPENTTDNDAAAYLSATESLKLGPGWATSETPPAPSAPKHFREERDDRGGFRDRDGGGQRGGFGGNRPQRRDGHGGGFGGNSGGGQRGGFGHSHGGGGGFGGAPRRDGGGNFGGNPGGGHSGGGFGSSHGGGFGGGQHGRPPFNRGPRGDNFGRGGNGGGGGQRGGFGGERGGFRHGGTPSGANDPFNAPVGGDGFPRSDFPSRGFRPAPVVEIAFYPEDKPFGVLTKALKASLRTYELFEIARLILEKEDRFTVVCRPFNAEQNPAARLYQSVPDGLPFLSETDATAHVLRNHLDRFCEQATVTVEPPKGVFQMVSRCGFTGEILGPPNYHGYQQTLREHHAARLGSVPYERFTARIESVRDKAEIDKWLQAKTQVTRYTLRKTPEGADAAPAFDSLDALRNHLLAHCKSEIVRVVKEGRFSGKNIAGLPVSPLRSAVERELFRQRELPLAFAGFLRGRLRKLGFILYKRGPKEINYVSAVERKFRQPGTVFADSIQRVFDFIEQRSNRKPYVKFVELPEKFLGILPGEQLPADGDATQSGTGGSPVVSQPDAPETSATAAATADEQPAAPAPNAEATAQSGTGGSPVVSQPDAPETSTSTADTTADESAAPAASSEAAAESGTGGSPVISQPDAPETSTSTADTTATAAAAEQPAVPALAPNAEADTAAASEVQPTGEPPVPQPAAAPAATPAPAAKSAPRETRAAPATALDLNNPAIRELFSNVRWLVSEGYVTEFSDGGLFANPVRAAATAPAAPTANDPATAAGTAAAAAALPAIRQQKKKPAAHDRRQRRATAAPAAEAPAQSDTDAVPAASSEDAAESGTGGSPVISQPDAPETPAADTDAAAAPAEEFASDGEPAAQELADDGAQVTEPAYAETEFADGEPAVAEEYASAEVQESAAAADETAAASAESAASEAPANETPDNA